MMTGTSRILSVLSLVLAGACTTPPEKRPMAFNPPPRQWQPAPTLQATPVAHRHAATPSPVRATTVQAIPAIARPAPSLIEQRRLPDSFPERLPSVRADSLILIDARNGRVLAQKNADVRRAVASTQKLVTALVVLDADNLDKEVTIQASDTRVEPTKLYLKPGEKYTRRALLNAILVKSANDAAMALARDNAGSIDAFARRMNDKARQLGAANSNFLNPHGLTAPGQHSTARDMARIALAAHRHPFIRQAVTQKQYTFRMPNGSKTLQNTNKLLGKMAACTGMKTGYTRASGRCLVTTANMDSGPLILVQLGSETRYIFNDAERLMNWSAGNASPARLAALDLKAH